MAQITKLKFTHIISMFGNEYSARIQKLYCGTSAVHSLAIVALARFQSTVCVLLVFYYIYCRKEKVKYIVMALSLSVT